MYCRNDRNNNEEIICDINEDDYERVAGVYNFFKVDCGIPDDDSLSRDALVYFYENAFIDSNSVKNYLYYICNNGIVITNGNFTVNNLLDSYEDHKTIINWIIQEKVGMISSLNSMYDWIMAYKSRFNQLSDNDLTYLYEKYIQDNDVLREYIFNTLTTEDFRTGISTTPNPLDVGMFIEGYKYAFSGYIQTCGEMGTNACDIASKSARNKINWLFSNINLLEKVTTSSSEFETLAEFASQYSLYHLLCWFLYWLNYSEKVDNTIKGYIMNVFELDKDNLMSLISADR